MNQLKDYEIERLCDRFAEELVNWSYEEWKYAGSADKEEIFHFVLRLNILSLCTAFHIGAPAVKQRHHIGWKFGREEHLLSCAWMYKAESAGM